MQTLHTPALHKLLGTPVTLDLGSTTGALADIAIQVHKLDSVSENTAGLQARFTTLASHVSTETSNLRTDIKSALDAAVDEIVQRVGSQVEPEPEDFEIGTSAAPLVRLLVQAQALAIAREPGSTEDRGDENTTMEKLGAAARRLAKKAFGDADKELHESFIAAFAPFASTDAHSRSERFVEMHALVEEIAQHFDGE